MRVKSEGRRCLDAAAQLDVYMEEEVKISLTGSYRSLRKDLHFRDHKKKNLKPYICTHTEMYYLAFQQNELLVCQN